MNMHPSPAFGDVAPSDGASCDPIARAGQFASRVLAAIDEAAVLLDPDGRIVGANGAGARLLDSDRLRITHCNRLALINAADHLAFRRAFDTLVASKSGNAHRMVKDGLICVAHGPDGSVTALKLRPVPLPAWRHRQGRHGVLIFLCDWQSGGRLDLRPLEIEFGLTATETELVAHIAEGRPLTSFAAARGITLSTARWHLKNAEAKTGTNRSEQLVAMAYQRCFRHRPA